MHLGGDQRVEVTAHGLDVRGEKADPAVLGVEERAVEVHELRRALVERRPHRFEDVLDGHRIPLRHAPRALDAEAARRTAQAEAAGARRVDHQVAAVDGRDAPHRRAARRPPFVEPGLRHGPDLDPERLGAVELAAHEEEPLAVDEQMERRAGGRPLLDGRAHPGLVGEHEVERAGHSGGAGRPAEERPVVANGRVEHGTAGRELELERSRMDSRSHVSALQSAQPLPTSATALPPPTSTR